MIKHRIVLASGVDQGWMDLNGEQRPAVFLRVFSLVFAGF